MIAHALPAVAVFAPEQSPAAPGAEQFSQLKTLLVNASGKSPLLEADIGESEHTWPQQLQRHSPSRLHMMESLPNYKFLGLF